jgi:hypothetical protein
MFTSFLFCVVVVLQTCSGVVRVIMPTLDAAAVQYLTVTGRCHALETLLRSVDIEVS